MGSVKLGSLILVVTIVADAASAAFLRSHETRLNASSILKLGNDRCGCPPGTQSSFLGTYMYAFVGCLI